MYIFFSIETPERTGWYLSKPYTKELDIVTQVKYLLTVPPLILQTFNFKYLCSNFECLYIHIFCYKHLFWTRISCYISEFRWRKTTVYIFLCSPIAGLVHKSFYLNKALNCLNSFSVNNCHLIYYFSYMDAVNEKG